MFRGRVRGGCPVCRRVHEALAEGPRARARGAEVPLNAREERHRGPVDRVSGRPSRATPVV